MNNNIFSTLTESLQTKLSELNISEPTKVQQEIIPHIQQGENILFESETGTGKTFAYLLPLIDALEKENESEKKQGVRILIIAPTYELASQINMACKSISQIKTALFIGGTPVKRQLEALKEKPQIVIGNAARLVELIRLKKLKTNDVSVCVFDECDRLVKKEAFADTNELRCILPKACQIIGCSATINKQCKIFFGGINSVVLEKEDILKNNITHWAMYAEERDKIDTLRKFLSAEKTDKVLIFTSRANQVENIYAKLTYKKIECLALYAKADKQKRKAAIDKFRSGKCKILITSDVSARGLDIPEISHVIHMDLPEDEDFFIHRSGRTGRAGKKGINVVIGDKYEMRHFAQLEKKLGIIVYPKIIYQGKICAPDYCNND